MHTDKSVVSPSMYPMVSVIVPTLNEELHLEDCIASIEATRYPRDCFEILVVDGGSQDRTVASAHALAERFGNVRVLRNPGRIQSRAMNIGLREASEKSRLIIRADAHSIYPADFISLCVASIDETQADVVVFAAVPVDQGGCFQKAVACAQSTPLGVGNSHYRLAGGSRLVEHGFHGCFRREILERSGFYDENFTHNEDGELSYRIRQVGGLIFLDQNIQVSYVPRRTFNGLFRQYRAYGRGRAKNVLKHRVWPSLRQVAPVGLVVVELLLLVLSPLALLGLAPALVPTTLSSILATYIAVLVLTGLAYAFSRKKTCLLLLPVALSAMHHSWGLGFVEQLGKALRSRSCRSFPASRGRSQL